MPVSLGELARQFDCKLLGDADVLVTSVASLGNAGSDSLSFLSGAAFKPQLATTRAAAVILRASDAKDCPTASLVHDNPYACYARIAGFLYPPPAVEPGIHPTAVVSSSAHISRSAQISAHVFVGDRSTIGENTFIGPGGVVGTDCVIGDNCRVLANITIVRKVTIGDRVILHPGAVIGSDGFGNAMTAEGWVKVPQLGGVLIGNDVEIGANTTIDLGALENTVIEDGVRIDNLVHVGHNVKIGAHTAVAAMSGFSGSVVVGKRCMFAGQSGVAGHVTICDDVLLYGKGLITKDVMTPGAYSSSFPSEPASEWNRMVARFRRIGNLIERVSKLEKRES